MYIFNFQKQFEFFFFFSSSNEQLPILKPLTDVGEMNNKLETSFILTENFSQRVFYLLPSDVISS